MDDSWEAGGFDAFGLVAVLGKMEKQFQQLIPVEIPICLQLLWPDHF